MGCPREVMTDDLVVVLWAELNGFMLHHIIVCCMVGICALDVPGFTEH